MIGSRVARRYAKALFELGQEKELLSQVEQDLGTVLDVIKSSEEFQHLLESPIIDAKEKQRIISELFKERVHPIVFRFLNLLLEKNREVILPVVIRHFETLLDESRGIVRGFLYTAREFSDEQRETLKKRLDQITGKNVILEQELDESLLGGFIIRIDDTVIDTSLKNQLSKLRHKLVSG